MGHTTSVEKIEPIQEKKFVTSSGIELKRVYTGEDAASLALDMESPLAGQFPFTRGIHPNGYRERLWTIREYCGFGTAKETNKRFHYLIKHGETGLSLAFDLPTQIGLDPDDAQSRGEVGKVGVNISGLWDFEELMKGIDPSKVSLSMTINATAFILYALYYALAKKRKLDPKVLRGTVQNDILKEYIARGTYSYPLKPSLRITTDLMEFSLEHTPQFYPISISGYHIREAGATAVDELAFTFADALVYIETARARGIALEKLLPRLSFFFGVHNHMLEEIAKFRAARKIWAKLLKKNYGIEEPKLLHLRFHAQTCGSTLTKEEPMNNAVRVTLQAISAILGGVQSLHTNSYDEALAIPTDQAQLLALRTQQLLAVETGIADCVDPVGGSYAIEALTQEIERKVFERLKSIEDMGGMTEAVQRGFPQAALAEEAYKYQSTIESGQTKVVGVNFLGGEKALALKAFKVKAQSERFAVSQIKQKKKMRKQSEVKKILERLIVAAKGTENLMPLTIEALEAYATLGEIAGALRGVFGTYS